MYLELHWSRACRGASQISGVGWGFSQRAPHRCKGENPEDLRFRPRRTCARAREPLSLRLGVVPRAALPNRPTPYAQASAVRSSGLALVLVVAVVVRACVRVCGWVDRYNPIAKCNKIYILFFTLLHIEICFFLRHEPDLGHRFLRQGVRDCHSNCTIPIVFIMEVMV